MFEHSLNKPNNEKLHKFFQYVILLRKSGQTVRLDDRYELMLRAYKHERKKQPNINPGNKNEFYFI